MAKVAIDEDALDEAQGALEDVASFFTRERRPSPGRPVRWFIEVEMLGNTVDLQLGDRLAEALERGHGAVDKLANGREAMPE